MDNYDSASRLQSVRTRTNSAKYSYVANSPLVGQIFFTNGSTLRMTTSKTFDFLNRLTSISSVPSAASVVNVEYSYNAAGAVQIRVTSERYKSGSHLNMRQCIICEAARDA